MSKVKEYTFKDWLKGNITPIKEGAHPVLKGEHGRIISLSATKQLSKADAIQIQDAKKEAFNIAVKQGVRVLYAIKKQTMAKAELPNKYLQSVIDGINAELNDNPKILQRIYSGDISTDAIDINLYKKIIEYGDKGVLHSKLWQKNELYRLKCRYLLRERLKENKPKISNAEKLDVAADWMDEFMRKITEPELPTDDEIKQLFNEVYPGFKLEFDMNSLKTPKFSKGRKLIKTSIGEALKFIVLEKHPEIKEVTGDAIIKRYRKMGYW